MKRNTILWGLMAAMPLLFVGCTDNQKASDSNKVVAVAKKRIRPTYETGNGVYYWKTVFKLSETEKQFLKEQKVEKLYLRLFDVDYDVDYDGRQKSIPIATTRFVSEIPENVEVVPVVYITQSAIKKDHEFAKVLYDRIKAMGKRNGFENQIWEIQLDCDWTAGSREPFFALCREVADFAHQDGIEVSATIRLHQLKQSAPPVDKGVLMLYNTGSLYRKETKNSILSYSDVAPYLKGEINYKAPLSLAFPIYGWAVLFRNNQFAAILHHTDFSDQSLYKEMEDDRYQVSKSHYLDNVELKKGDIIRLERSSYDEIMKVKEKVMDCLEDSFQNHVIYHLDSLGLSKFSKSELSNILK